MTAEKLQKSKQSIVCWGLLLLIILANGYVLQKWCRLDTRPLGWDESIHTRLAFEYNDRLKNEGIGGILRPAYFNYPPLYHVLLGRVVNLPKDIADAGAIVNFFFLAGLIIVTFLLAVELNGPWMGVIAALAVSSFPAVVELTRPPMIDLSLTFWVSFAVYAGIKSEAFQSKMWSSLFGASLGLGLLTKWSAPAYIAGPLVWILVSHFRQIHYRHFFLSLTLSGLIALPWYAYNLFPMLNMFKRVTNLTPAGGVIMGGWKSWLWYPFALGEAVNILFCLLLFPGMVAAVRKPKLRPIGLWLIVPLFLFSLIHNRNIRYMVPALPAVALLCAAWIPSVKKLPAVLLFLIGIIFFGFAHFGPATRLAVVILNAPFGILNNDQPKKEDWRHREIISLVDQLRMPGDELTRVIVLSNAAQLHSTTLNVSCRVQGVSGISFDGPSRGRWMDFAEFILLKTKEWGPEFTLGNIKPAAELILNPPDWFKKSYRETGRWMLPDESEAVLFQVHPTPMPKLGVEVLSLNLKEFKLPNLTLMNVGLSVKQLSPKDSAVGRFETLTLQCKQLLYKKMSFANVSFEFLKPHINLPKFLETGDIQFFSLESLRPRAELSSQLLLDYSQKKAKWLSQPQIVFEGSRIRMSGKVRGIPIEILLTLSATDSHLTFKLEKIRLSGIAIPSLFFRGLTDRKVPLTPNPEFPFNLKLTPMEGKGAVLMVGGGS